jgi:hypothetical protein
MKVHVLILAGAMLLTPAAAFADDHLVQATLSGGLVDNGDDTISNKAGHQIPDNGAGQGSPFIGEHQCTPSSDNGAEHANVKPRGPEAGDCTAE